MSVTLVLGLDLDLGLVRPLASLEYASLCLGIYRSRLRN